MNNNNYGKLYRNCCCHRVRDKQKQWKCHRNYGAFFAVCHRNIRMFVHTRAVCVWRICCVSFFLSLTASRASLSAELLLKLWTVLLVIVLSRWVCSSISKQKPQIIWQKWKKSSLGRVAVWYKRCFFSGFRKYSRQIRVVTSLNWFAQAFVSFEIRISVWLSSDYTVGIRCVSCTSVCCVSEWQRVLFVFLLLLLLLLRSRVL